MKNANKSNSITNTLLEVKRIDLEDMETWNAYARTQNERVRQKLGMDKRTFAVYLKKLTQGQNTERLIFQGVENGRAIYRNEKTATTGRRFFQGHNA